MWDLLIALLLIAFGAFYYFNNNKRTVQPETKRATNPSSVASRSQPVTTAQTATVTLPSKVVEAPKVESPKVESPKAESPKVDAPKVEAPKAESPKAVEASKSVEAEEPKTLEPEEEEEEETMTNEVEEKLAAPEETNLKVQEEEEENGSTTSSPSVSDEESSVTRGWVKISSLKVEWGVAELQGKRPNMEDAHVTLSKEDNGPHQEKLTELGLLGLWAIYDGHKGQRAAQFAADHLHDCLFKHIESNGGRAISEVKMREAIRDSFVETDASLIEDEVKEGYSDGSTAVLAFIQEGNQKLFIANIGDAEALLAKTPTAENPNPLVVTTTKHKPNVPTELKRIKDAGGIVVFGRLSGLSVSRSFGDKELKIPSEEDGNKIGKLMLEEPDINAIELNKDDDMFLIVGCDGVWETFSHADSVQFVRSQLVDETTGNKRTANELSAILTKEALRRGSTDNISAIVVLFDWTD